jgi:hypothetical protein
VTAVTEETMRIGLSKAARLWGAWMTVAAVCLASPCAVRAQGLGDPTVSDSRDGYIDNAIPGNEFRLRFDASYDDNRPNRAEFFYPRPAPRGPGLPLPEPRVDFQELSAYLELAASERLSGFVEVPWRFLNPEVNVDHNGVGDMNAGFKYAFIHDPDLVATFQFRVWAPTGDSHEGLGNHHVTLEPALLLWKSITERCGLEAELRYWAPAGGTDFAGDIIRYGIGAHYDLACVANVRFSPTATLVGWTVLGGKEGFTQPSGKLVVIDAAGETIVNFKIGLRARSERCGDVFVGYGRPLTGDRWYQDTLRVEWRLAF